MRRPRPPRVLGLDPGTKHMGAAVLEGHELIYKDVLDLARRSPRGTLARTREVADRVVSDFKPELLVIEQTFFNKGRYATLLRMVTDEITALAEQRGLEVLSLAPSTVKKAMTGNGHASKRDVAKVVCKGYPDLRAFVGCDRRWKERYHSNMFDAIAVAAVGLTYLQQRESLE